MSVTEKKPLWLRARIKGSFIVRSPLHIGSGDAYASQQKVKNRDNQTEELRLVNSVCKDNNEQPYLPGSSLRGALRASLDSGPIRDALFGESHGESETADMGKLRCYDAQVREPIKTVERTGVTINPQLGVAEAHKLYTHETVPIETCFDVLLELDQVGSAEIGALLTLLEALNSPLASGLGKGKRKDQGKLQWQLEEFATIDAEALTNWLKSKQKTLPWTVEKVIPPSTPNIVNNTAAQIGFEIEFFSPWLVNAPELCRPKSKEDPHPGDLEFCRSHDGRAWLPASSIKGWLRGHARRILLTLLIHRRGVDTKLAETTTDAQLDLIFGSTEAASWLLVSDAYSAEKTPSHPQQFGAIDRFTGGNKDSALYKVNAASPTIVSGNIGIQSLALNSAPDWRLGLLILVARDAMEGDLNIGWGKSRGYGRGQLRFKAPVQQAALDWAQLLEQYKDTLQPHMDALQQHINLVFTEKTHD